MSESNNTNKSKMIKCLIKKSSLILEKFKKNEQPQLSKQCSSTKGVQKQTSKESAHMMRRNYSDINSFQKTNEYNNINSEEMTPKQQFMKWQDQIEQNYFSLKCQQQIQQIDQFQNSDVPDQSPIVMECFSSKNIQSERKSQSFLIKPNHDRLPPQLNLPSEMQLSKKTCQSVSNQSSPLHRNEYPLKIADFKRRERMDIVNQAIQQDQLKKKLQKIADERKVAKIFTNKILPKEQEPNNANGGTSTNQKLPISTVMGQQRPLKFSSRFQSNQRNIMTNSSCTLQNNNSPNKGTYNFKTASKNCLEIMQEALLKRQQILEKNKSSFAESKKDVNTTSNQDISIIQYLQLKKRTQFMNLHNSSSPSASPQVENSPMSPQLVIRPMSTNLENYHQFMKNNYCQSKQQWLESQQQQSPDGKQIQNLIKSQFMESNKVSYNLQFSQALGREGVILERNNSKILNTSPNLMEDKCNLTTQQLEDSKINTSTTINQSMNQSDQIQKIKKLHKSVFQMSKQNHLKQYFTPPKQNISNHQPTQSTFNLANNQNSNSVTVHCKNRSDLVTIKKEKQPNKVQKHEDENYGPWDYQAESNIFASFNCITDRSEKQEKL